MIFPLILFIASALTHIAYFGWPQEVVFDEVHNGRFISNYANHSYFFDVHPPLGKLLAKFFADIVHAPYNIDWSAIGNSLPWGVILLRLLPVLAGTFLPIIIYYLCRHLSFSKLSSFAAASLVILENSLLVQSRFILFDIIMLLFGFSAVLLYFIYVKKGARWLLYSSAILAAAAFSIKWTGLAFPLIICIAEGQRVGFKKIAGFVAKYAVTGLIVYLAVFAVHFTYLTHTGPGDAFMTDRFQKTIIGSEHYNDHIMPKGFFGKVIELNVAMFDANKTLTATHEYSSSWWSWPLMLRPIFYWQGKVDPARDGNEYIYLLGNPLIYWLGAASILFLIWKIAVKKRYEKTGIFLLTAFLVNFIPFIFIGRVMFLYHYEAALVVSIIVLCYCIERYVSERYRAKVTWTLLAVCLILFIFFAPLTYGLHLSDSALHARMWLPSWR
jgi:dolichyl-phosphate-mannose-protein mannosyltransferase